MDGQANVIKKLEEIIGVQLRFFEEYKSYCKVLLLEVLWGLADRWQEQAGRIREQLFELVAKVIAEGINEGELQPELGFFSRIWHDCRGGF
ncbi:hypothetical protein SY88_05065 [Clostridiales bacterium PH28_bin88]|nr:hypothetical protein SY88_05065 [Clostridiales bacterium PH28_bin88]